ncbi:MAG: hypothetical protein LBF05_07790 [Tannerella sp.]|nr:hypothetical protein [Tannerella sp.]
MGWWRSFPSSGAQSNPGSCSVAGLLHPSAFAGDESVPRIIRYIGKASVIREERPYDRRL